MSDSPKGRDVNYGKIGDAHLELVPKVSECNPGLEPTEYNLIVAPAKMPEKLGSIILATTTQDQMSMAAQVGRIIACSPVAFNYERWPEGTKPPKIGDIVWFARYAGGLFEGLDGKEYRILKDKDIGAVITAPDASVTQEAA